MSDINFTAKKIGIRPAKASDIDRLLSIERQSFRAHRFGEKDFRYHLENPSSVFAVAESSSEPIGYIAGIIDHRPHRCVARIYSMAVLVSWRKHKIGSRLLKYFESEAARRDCGAITLEVRQTNRAARSLYERFGYEKDKVLADYYAEGRHGLKMRKTIEAK